MEDLECFSASDVGKSSANDERNESAAAFNVVLLDL